MIITTLCLILGVLLVGKVIKIVQMLTFGGKGVLCDKGWFTLFLKHDYLRLTCKPIPTDLEPEDWVTEANKMLAEYYSEYDYLYNVEGYKSVKFLWPLDDGSVAWTELTDHIKILENAVEQVKYELYVKSLLEGLEFKND